MSRIFFMLLALTLSVLLAFSTVRADDSQEQRKPRRGAGEEVAHRIQQLKKQLAEATRVGKEEIADRLKKEIGEYVQEAASERMQAARESAEAAVMQQIETLEKKVHQLREQGKPEIAQQLTAQLEQLLRSRHRAEDLSVLKDKRRLETARQAAERRRQVDEDAAAKALDAEFREAEERRLEAVRTNMKREISELHERGKHELAGQLEQKLHALMQERHDVVRREAQQHEAEMHDTAEQMERQIAKLHEHGDHELAEQLEQKLHASMQERHDVVHREAQQHEAEMRDRAEHMEREIAKLHEHGHHEEAERLEQELRAMMQAKHRGERAGGRHEQEPGQVDPREREELERRMHHLRVAAENLAAIGMHDLVERLQREAEEIDHALHAPPPADHDPHGGVMEAIHHEFRAIHQRLDELNERLDHVMKAHHEH